MDGNPLSTFTCWPAAVLLNDSYIWCCCGPWLSQALPVPFQIHAHVPTPGRSPRSTSPGSFAHGGGPGHSIFTLPSTCSVLHWFGFPEGGPGHTTSCHCNERNYIANHQLGFICSLAPLKTYSTKSTCMKRGQNSSLQNRGKLHAIYFQRLWEMSINNPIMCRKC